MAGALHKWWRAGEEGAVVVYRKHNDVVLILLFVFCCVSGGICWQLFPEYPLLPFIPVVVCAPIMAGCRIAIIFTPTAVIYRPDFGHPTRILFTGITSMRKVEIPSNWSKARFPGLLLELSLGQSLPMRLDMPRSNEILDRLRQATGNQVK
jgi:hypothetical protein